MKDKIKLCGKPCQYPGCNGQPCIVIQNHEKVTGTRHNCGRHNN